MWYPEEWLRKGGRDKERWEKGFGQPGWISELLVMWDKQLGETLEGCVLEKVKMQSKNFWCVFMEIEIHSESDEGVWLESRSQVW